MPVAKRKRSTNSEEREQWNDTSSASASVSESEDFDVSSALTGKRPKITKPMEDGDEDDIGEFIQASIAKRSTKEGTIIVKKAKGKEKVNKGEVGGGSFQSMGEFIRLGSNFTSSNRNCRFIPLLIALANFTRISDTNTHSKIFDTCSPCKSSERSRRNGSNWFWKIFSFPRSASPTSWWSSFNYFRSSSLDFASYSRASSSGLASRKAIGSRFS